MSLTRLVHHIAEIVAQGEDSGSQHSDATLHTRLREVMLSLLDQVVSTSGGNARDVGSVLKLLNLVLTKVPNMLAGSNHAVLSEVLERLVPILGRTELADVQDELSEAIMRLVALLGSVDQALFAGMAGGCATLLQDACGLALIMSAHPGTSAVVTCFPGVPKGTDSAEPRLQLALPTPAACELLLCSVLRVVAGLLQLRPLSLLPSVSGTVLPSCRHLLLSSSLPLQAAAMQCLGAAALVASSGSINLLHQFDAVEMACQHTVGRLALAAPMHQQEWWQQLLAMLQAMHEAASSSSSRGRLVLPRVVGLAVGLALGPTCPRPVQLGLCQLLLAAVIDQPQLLEAQSQVVQLLGTGSEDCRQVLHQALLCYLQQHPAEQVEQAVERALQSRGITAEAPAAVGARDQGAGTSARKRRRLGHTPPRSVATPVPAEAPSAAPTPQQDSEGLSTVLSALASQVPEPPPLEGQQREGHSHASDMDSATLSGLTSVITLLTAVAPAPAASLSMAFLPKRLAWTVANRQTLAANSGRLAVELRLLLAGLRAWVQHTEGSGAGPALAQAIDAEAVKGLLLLPWQQEGAGDAAAVAGEAAAIGDARTLALCAALLAAQADLAGGSPAVVDLLQQALSSQALPAKHAAALLLPAVCIVVGAREQAHPHHPPRASQGPRRQKQQQQHTPLPNLAVQLLQQQLGSQDQETLQSLVQGLALALGQAHEPAQLVAAAVSAALGAADLQPSQPAGAKGQPGFSSAVSEWSHAALERLCAADLPSPQAQVSLLAAMACFVRHGLLGQMEHSRPLAEWVLQQCSSKAAPVRCAMLRSAGLLTEPQFVLALCHEGTHPVHSKEREAAVERHECEVLKALQAQLGAAGASSAMREGLLQLITSAGVHMRSNNAHLLMLAIAVLQLDAREAAVRAAAAEVLAGVAEWRRCSLSDLLFADPRLLEMVGRNISSKPDLLAELAELLDMESPQQLALAILPAALPVVIADADQQGLAVLAEHAGLQPARMLQEYGHHVVAKQLFDGSESFGAFMALMEALTGQDFVAFVRSIMSRTIMEVILLAGSAPAWAAPGAGGGAPGALVGSAGVGAGVPDSVASRASSMLHGLSGISCDDEGGAGGLPAEEFLAEGDHVTRMVKEFGDRMDMRLPSAARPSMSPADTAAVLTMLRCVALLITLTGRFIGRFLPQLMVVLTAALRQQNPREVKLQGLEGWRLLEAALRRHAPMQMAGIVNQVVVTLLEPLLEPSGSTVNTAAVAVLRRLVEFCRDHYPEKLRSLPPLPQRGPELQQMHAEVLQARGQLDTRGEVELLVRSLDDESLAVRATALQALCNLLSQRRDWTMKLLSAEGGDSGSIAESSESSLVSRLISALLRCCEPEAGNVASFQAQRVCAECLGLLGAVDPSRVKVDLQPLAAMCSTDDELAVTLITRHLVRVLKTAPSVQALDATTFGIQELLRHYSPGGATGQQTAGLGGSVGGGDSGKAGRSREATPAGHNELFAQLPEEVRAIVRPYLDSKYSVRSNKRAAAVVFGSQPGMSFRRWLAMWLQQLIDSYASGERLWLFQAVFPVLRFDIPTALFIMPYLVENVVFHGSDKARDELLKELEAVLAGGPSTREGVLCLQAIFSLLDVLQRWSEEAKVAALGVRVRGERMPTDTGRPAIETDAKWSALLRLLGSIPKRLLAQAASQCGAHARALQYFEMHVRAKHAAEGGALNPAALHSAQYEDEEVSFLQEVYGRLEEPDGLQGLMKMRQGGPHPEDQRLAAEKAGDWSEALTIYEQAMQYQSRSSGGGGSSSGGGSGSAAAAALLECGLGAEAEGLSPTQRGYLGCLLNMGHLQGLLAQVEGMAAAGGSGQGAAAVAQLAAMGTAAAWRLGRWGLLEGYTQVAQGGYGALDPDARWEVRLGRLLGAVVPGDGDALHRELDAARSEVMGPFSAAAMESYDRAYPHLVKLHMLQEISDAGHALAGPAQRRGQMNWEERLALTQPSLATQEPILALRRQLTSLCGAGAEVGQCWLQYAQLCRATGHHEAATTAVLEAGACQVPTAGLEQVLLLWDKGQPYRAVAQLQQLDRVLSDAAPRSAAAGRAGGAAGEHSRYHAQVVLQLAQWMAETGQGTRDEIVELFERATSMEGRWETGLFRYAVYLDEVMSDAKRRQEDKAGAEAGGRANPGLDRLGGRSRIKLGEDRPHIEFLPEVIKNYGHSILYGHAHIYQSLPRMLTLWFEFGTHIQQLLANDGGKSLSNKERTIFSAVTNIITHLIKNIPMHAWLTALPQLISRMCHPNKDVAEQVKLIIVRVAQSYPQQAAWLLAGVRSTTQRNRRDVANAIIASAKKGSTTEVHKLFSEAQIAAEQWNKLAFLQPSSTKPLSARKEMSTLCRGMPLSLCMPTMAALTVNLPASGTVGKGWRAFGDELVSIAEVVDEVEVMHSLQRPKKITLVGSDGHFYVFLAKPKDDLRKDNRLMEVAGILNKLFASDPQARRRNLYLRRFAVIPLQDEAGIVEWVPNTRGIRHCLQDTYTAEGLFDGKTTNVTIKRMYDTFAGKRRADLLDSVLGLFPPKFHCWQLGKFPEPAAWLNARLAFTRTSGVWSMVGHMCGLGDRHGENILLDCSCGDVVQVDFSCLFDKGLTLDKPEMVPFRLTQNMIDGFGVSGPEGVFRRTCEITLDVLRRHRGTILSIMDTFVNDPLVEWTRAGRVNDEGCENPHARDALATVEGRLRGTLLGVSSQPCMPLSVEGHAHRLIAEAVDKENLGLMYIWWMPWF